MTKRSVGIVGFLVLVAALIVGGFLAVDRLAGEEATETVIDKPQLGTTPIVETDLIERETFPAVLRFADPQVLTASQPGTITSVPEVGHVLDQGDTVVEINGQPVFFFLGARPMWRTLALSGLEGSDTEGFDVKQLEQNLVDLGHLVLRDEEEVLPTISAPDEVFDEDTVRLVEDWRDGVGLPPGGKVELGRVIYLPGSVRVSRILAEKGSLVSPGVPIIEVSAETQEVFLQLPIDKRELVELGDNVLVTLPDDVVVGATITDIGSQVTYFDENEPGVIAVSLVLDDPSFGLGFDGSPVDVEIVSNEEIDVLAVPVNALLALAEGGYALEIEKAGVRTLVAVEAGIYVDGLVEVSGEIAAGDVVVVPK